MNTNEEPEIPGIIDQAAPELEVAQWIDKDGNETTNITLADYPDKYVVLFCFQSWCKGCHTEGFPKLQEITKALKDNKKVAFLAIQTVFEGSEANTYEKIKPIQKQYDLNIPFGHDVGDSTSTGFLPSTLLHYNTGGTPWFIIIDPERDVIYNDFSLDTISVINYFESIK